MGCFFFGLIAAFLGGAGERLRASPTGGVASGFAMEVAFLHPAVAFAVLPGDLAFEFEAGGGFP